MKILIVEPGKHPRRADVPHTLKAMQEIVGGYIQAVFPWRDPVALVCDEEGLLKQKFFNRCITAELQIFGTFFLCGIDDDDFADLPDELAEKYSQKLHDPHYMIMTEDGLVVQIGEEEEEATECSM